MKFLAIIFNPFLFTCLAMASSEAGHGVDHESGVPKVVYFQAINVLIILFAAVFYGRKPVFSYFQSKKAKFIEDQDRAQSFYKRAEQEFNEVKTRLDKLKVTREDALAKAKADALDLQKKLVNDGEALAKKTKDEAFLTSKMEVERAKQYLKAKLIADAFELSKRDLSAKATSADQKKLQEDFISKVQVVQ